MLSEKLECHIVSYLLTETLSELMPELIKLFLCIYSLEKQMVRILDVVRKNMTKNLFLLKNCLYVYRSLNYSIALPVPEDLIKLPSDSIALSHTSKMRTKSYIYSSRVTSYSKIMTAISNLPCIEVCTGCCPHDV